MAQFPCFPLWTDAWIADTKHLTRYERGTYLDLLVLMWRTHGCRAPNDDQWLAKHLGMTVAEVVAELRPLLAEFCETDGNWVYQKRQRREYVRRFAQGQAQSDRAKHPRKKKKDLSPGLAEKHDPAKPGPAKPPEPEHLSKTTSFFPTAATPPAVAEKQQLGPARSFASAPDEGALAREPTSPPAEPKRSAEKDPLRKTMAEINYEAFGIGTGRRKRTY